MFRKKGEKLQLHLSKKNTVLALDYTFRTVTKRFIKTKGDPKYHLFTTIQYQHIIKINNKKTTLKYENCQKRMRIVYDI